MSRYCETEGCDGIVQASVTVYVSRAEDGTWFVPAGMDASVDLYCSNDCRNAGMSIPAQRTAALGAEEFVTRNLS